MDGAAGVTYPSEWKGSADPADLSGVATFSIDGVDYVLRLDSFKVFQLIGDMLDISFNQGKRFAAQAMRSHINHAMDRATEDHAL